MKARAFTLIELLVVVAIIALLISILLPSLSSARATARLVKCQANQKQYYNANHMYADAHGGDYVPIKTAHGTRGGSYWSWANGNRNNSTGATYRRYLGVRSNTNPLNVMPCPDRPDPFKFGSSYAWSEIWIRKTKPGNLKWSDHLGVQRPLVLLPAAKMMMVDATDWHMFRQGNMNYKTRWDITGELRNNSGAYRHKEGANVLHFDGHAEWYHKTALYDSRASVRRRLMDIYRN